MKITLTTVCFIFGLTFSFGFENKNIDFNVNLHDPIKINMILAGNFCELRSNHFHTGIDIKTNNTEGYKLYAIEKGIISRIKISPWGYGKAIYIQHSNGLTSVYAHCSKFPPLIDSLIYAIQQKKESAIIDEDLRSYHLPVKRGEIIAYSGNSGGSTAPHLHFEIRETKTEHAINPLLFSCYRKKILDTRPPEIRGIKLYALSKNGYMIPGKSKYLSVKKNGNSLIVNNGDPININSLLVKNSVLGFGIHSYDRLNGAHNVCGIHDIKIIKDSTILHHQKIDYMNFDISRYINSHKDYFAFKNRRQHIHKQFATSLNQLPIYPIKNGRIEWSSSSGVYNVIVKDVHGNQSKLIFKLEKTSAEFLYNILENGNYYFPQDLNIIKKDGFEALLEGGTFYEPIQKVIKSFPYDSTKILISPVFQLFENLIPVQQKYDIRIKIPAQFSSLNQYKMGVAIIDNKNRIYFQGGEAEEGWITARVKKFGKFALAIDTIAPKITPLDFKENQNISKYSTLEMTITDNLSGVSKYKAFLNGNWVLLEYNKKNGKYIVKLSARTKAYLNFGENDFKVIASDRKYNYSSQKFTLIYNALN